MQSVWAHWADNVNNVYASKPLDGDIRTDALIIGGGIAGVLCAHALAERGVRCVIAEARRMGCGVTRNTTAKITAQHGFIYHDTIKRFGLERARQCLSANQDAIARYRALSAQYPCDFEETPAFVYTMDDKKRLEREAAAYDALGLDATISHDLPLPFNTLGALRMEGQAQFHPLKLLYGLARGLDIYENAFVRRIEGHTALTDNGKVSARHIILATHYPMVNTSGLYFMKMYQHRSYVVAMEGAPEIDGMYVDERADGHSFRQYQNLLFIGGGDHRTGARGGALNELRALARRSYPAAREQYAWATQDCMTLDGLPYIGRHSSREAELYVATGFNKWGMTSAMAAATLLADLITMGKSAYEALYSPRRTMLRSQLIANMASSAAGLLSFGGPRCAHMGCKLKWNALERTWDCNCHGSRFDENGNVIDNPAIKGIRR